MGDVVNLSEFRRQKMMGLAGMKAGYLPPDGDFFSLSPAAMIALLDQLRTPVPVRFNKTAEVLKFHAVIKSVDKS